MWKTLHILYGIRGRLLVAALFGVLATQVSAACYADYKAKKDDPLQLHYGVIELPANLCENGTSPTELVARRIAAEGWLLLNVVSTFDDSGLEERMKSAGEFYLRF